MTMIVLLVSGLFLYVPVSVCAKTQRITMIIDIGKLLKWEWEWTQPKTHHNISNTYVRFSLVGRGVGLGQ
jgi:hypothetical protein